MTCKRCKDWAAISEQQLTHRLRQIATHPQMQVYRCPNCNGDDWATTRENIQTVDSGRPDLGYDTPPSSWWRRLLWRIGL